MRKLSIIILLTTWSTMMFSQPELVVDFNQGSANSFGGNYWGEYLGEDIVLPIDSETVGLELAIISDGQLSVLKDINEGIEDSDPREFTLYNGVLYFSAKTAANDFAIWKTDGTPDGTVMEFDPGDSSSARPRAFTVAANGWMYYNYDGKIFRTDGSVHEELYDGASLGYLFSQASYNYCAYKNGIAWITKNNDYSFSIYHMDDNMAVELARTEETEFHADGFGLAPVSNGLMFSIYDSDIDAVFIYDESDQMISRITVNGEYAPSRRTINLNDDVNISWVGGVGYYLINGVEGEEQEIFATTSNSAGQGDDIVFSVHEDKAVFIASESFIWGDHFLIHTDGTVAGTTNIGEIGSEFSDMVKFEKYAFVADRTSNGFEPTLYQVDMETGDLSTVFEFTQSSNVSRSIRPLGVQKGQLYFLSNLDGDVGLELYRINVEVGYSDTKEVVENLAFNLIQNNNTIEIKTEDSESLTVSIYNMAGQVFYQGQVMSNRAFEVNLINGSYIVNVSSDEGTDSRIISVTR